MDCLEIKTSDIWHHLKKSTKISGVEFGEKSEAQCKGQMVEDLKSELDALGKQGEVKISAPMIKKTTKENSSQRKRTV